MTTRSWIRNVFTRPVTRPIRKAAPRTRLAVEGLEDRTVPSTTFTVSSIADSGAGSLREAVGLANSTAGADTIAFDSSFNTARTIALSGGQLTLTDAATTTISGTGANLLSISGNNASRVFAVDPGASAALSGLTITGGVGIASGGGLEMSGNTLTLTNCTVSGNSAGTGTAFGFGGGLRIFNGTAALTNCTVSGNVAGTAVASGAGGGIFNDSMTTTLNNTIVAGNTDPRFGANDIRITRNVSGSNNLIGAGGSGGLVNGVNGNIVGVADAMLAPLGDYGGPTQTMPLLPGSLALNAGNNALIGGVTTDQRGLGRIVGGTVDIGAVEVQNVTQAVPAFLEVYVNNLVTTGVLTSGQGEALVLNLRDNNGDAGKVQAFLNQVAAFRSADILTQAQADELLYWGNILLLSVTQS